MRINDDVADKEFQAHLHNVHINKIPFGIFISLCMCFPSVYNVTTCYNAMHVVQLTLNFLSAIILIISLIVTRRSPQLVAYLNTLAWFCIFAQKFLSCVSGAKTEFGSSMSMEFTQYLAMFVVYFMLFNSDFCLTQYIMIPTFTITYGISAAMIFAVEYGIFIVFLCIVAFFFWAYLNYDFYTNKAHFFLQSVNERHQRLQDKIILDE